MINWSKLIVNLWPSFSHEWNLIVGQVLLSNLIDLWSDDETVSSDFTFSDDAAQEMEDKFHAYDATATAAASDEHNITIVVLLLSMVTSCMDAGWCWW